MVPITRETGRRELGLEKSSGEVARVIFIWALSSNKIREKTSRESKREFAGSSSRDWYYIVPWNIVVLFEVSISENNSILEFVHSDGVTNKWCNSFHIRIIFFEYLSKINKV